MPDNTHKSSSLSRRWGAYRPTKGVWFWSSLGCIVATIVVGFAWGGWVTGGAATRMASDAAAGARAELAAMVCVAGFNQGPDAAAQLAELKKLYGFDKPAHVRYVEMLGNFARFDLGRSFTQNTERARDPHAALSSDAAR